MGMQNYPRPEEHTEVDTKMTVKTNLNNGSSSKGIDFADECCMDIAPCGARDSNNNACYSIASTAPTDGPVPSPAALPIVTLTMETPPRCPNTSFLNVTVSPANSCYSSMGPMCRICHEGDSCEELISPCKCTGSLALVHKHCLERWLNLTNSNKCELCCHIFSIRRTPRPFWKSVMRENSETRRSIIVDMTCFLILTPLAALSLYLCISSAIFYSKHTSTRTQKRPSFQKTEHWKVVLARSLGLDDSNVANETSSTENQYENVIGWDIIGLVMLAFLLLAIYVAWLTAAVVYHVKTYQQWRNVNQNLVLAENQQRVSIENHRRASCFSIINRSYEQMEEEGSPDSFSTSNIRSPVDLSFSPAARYLERDTDQILFSRNEYMIHNSPGINEKYLPSRNIGMIAYTPAVSERHLSLSNLETPHSSVVKSLSLEELSVDNSYYCISLNDSIPSLPKLNSSYTQGSSTRFSSSFCRSNSVSSEIESGLPPLPLSPCVPRYDL